MAVPSASRPMRNTTVLPPRSTPVASAKTFGRPSNTNPITPSGARRRSTRQPGCSTPSMSWSRSDGMSRQVRRPATMSARIRSESTQPRRAAALRPGGGDVVGVGRRDAGEHGRVLQPAGEALEEGRDRGVREPAQLQERLVGRGRRRRRPARGRRPGSAAGRRCPARRPAGRRGRTRGPGPRTPWRSGRRRRRRAGPPPAAPTGRIRTPATVTPCGRTGW